MYASKPKHLLASTKAADEIETGFDVLKWIRESGGGASVRPGIDSTGVRGLIFYLSLKAVYSYRVLVVV